MIDLDAALYVEYDDGSKEPLALIETARDVGQTSKVATVTRNLAIRAGLPCYTLLYRCADHANPADENWPDIVQFKVRRVWPRPERGWRTVSPQQWAEALLVIRGYSARALDLRSAELLPTKRHPERLNLGPTSRQPAS